MYEITPLTMTKTMSNTKKMLARLFRLTYIRLSSQTSSYYKLKIESWSYSSRIVKTVVSHLDLDMDLYQVWICHKLYVTDSMLTMGKAKVGNLGNIYNHDESFSTQFFDL